jgi:hypothetical protein
MSLMRTMRGTVVGGVEPVKKNKPNVRINDRTMISEYTTRLIIYFDFIQSKIKIGTCYITQHSERKLKLH